MDERNDDQVPGQDGLSRRQMLGRTAAGGAAVWAVPAIIGFDRAGAQEVSRPPCDDDQWDFFFFDDVGSVAGPFPVTGTVLDVTDSFLKGDQFRILFDGNPAGDTSAVPTSDVDTTDGACEAFADPSYSSGTFAVPAGATQLTIEVLASPFGGGGAYYRFF